jgi:hypothetical protein
MHGALKLQASAALLVALIGSSPAFADPPCGRGWRKHEACGPIYVVPVYSAPRIVVLPPPPVVVQQPFIVAPVPVYVPPPVVFGPPSLQLGVSIPLH